jgi:hypothetical protein
MHGATIKINNCSKILTVYILIILAYSKRQRYSALLNVDRSSCLLYTAGGVTCDIKTHFTLSYWAGFDSPQVSYTSDFTFWRSWLQNYVCIYVRHFGRVKIPPKLRWIFSITRDVESHDIAFFVCCSVWFLYQRHFKHFLFSEVDI